MALSPFRTRMTRSPYSPAERLVMELCRGRPSSEAVERLLARRDAGTFEALTALAMRHAVQGLVLSRLAALQAAEGLWPETADAVRTGLALLRRQATFWDLEQDRVLGGLNRVGLHPLVLKGGALRRSVFTPIERAMGDLDILVERHEVGEVLTALEGLGYRSEYPDRARMEFLEHHHHDRVAHPRGFLVEVHWGLNRPYDLIQLDPSRFLGRAVTLEPSDGPALRVPAPEDTLVHTVSQSEQDGVRGLRRIVDLDRVAATPGLDWDDVREHARAVGLHGVLCVTLRLAHLLLGTEVPSDLLAGEGLSERARRAISALDPVRRLLEEPGRADVVEFHLFRLWCARPDHRDLWLRESFSGRRDPLHWVWEGEEEPDAAASEGSTGPSFLLKLAAFQSILTLSGVLNQLRRPGDAESDFWRA